MAGPERRFGRGGITLGGIIVIAGIVFVLVGWTIVGIVVILLGLIAFGGFVRGRWY